MFMVTKVGVADIWFVHQSLGSFWIKFKHHNSNHCESLIGLYNMMRFGKRSWIPCESLYFNMTRRNPEISYYETAEDFMKKYAEYLI